jgi:four helix bundle protein
MGEGKKGIMRQFDHEKLNVYQSSIQFAAWAAEILTMVPKSAAAHNQLDRASTSISLNIAEGNGKFTAADRCRFFDNARGSALESAACLDILVAKSILPLREALAGKEMLFEIVCMLVGLIRSNSPTRDV